MVGYDQNHAVIVGPIRVLDTLSEIRLAQKVRFDSFDRSLLVQTQFGKPIKIG